MIGIIIGTLAFCLDFLCKELSAVRWVVLNKTIQEGIGLGWFTTTLVSTFFILLSASIVMLVAPTTLGSGVAEAMGFLNGVHISDYIGFKQLFVKFFGLVLAVSGGICGGKEGPLINMGAIIGYLSANMPLLCFRYFRNDYEKRKLLAAGIAAGVSAAFGSPIGGALFAYEISKPNTFWSFSLTWKIFFASSISTFVLSLL